MELTPFQKKLCNALQNGLPITRRPFADIARQLASDENTVIEETTHLIESGIIRRVSATVNYASLGRVSTLVTAHVGEQQLDAVAAAVNKLDGVSHNYLRDHFYNLWFTLQAASSEQGDSILARLNSETSVEFHSLPAVETFKLDVRFDAESGGRALLPCGEKTFATEGTEIVLNNEEKDIIKKLQQNLEIVSEPFSDLHLIKNLIEKRVIRRIAAVVDYRRLGFDANAMLACEVEDGLVGDVGRQLAASNNVSHCYQRKTFEGWCYNLFAMLHGHEIGQLEQIAKDFALRHPIRQFALLKTLREFKKKPVSI